MEVHQNFEQHLSMILPKRDKRSSLPIKEIKLLGNGKMKLENKMVKKSGEYTLEDKYEFRSIRPEEADQAVHIEQICFPPHEACSEKSMKERIAKAPELFLVAVEKETGKLAGFLNGLATDENLFRDEFFTDVNLYQPDGKNIMLLGLDVLPEHRNQGLARKIVLQYLRREQENSRDMLILTCLQNKVKMYEKMGFVDRGIANSTWGGEEWHEMTISIGNYLALLD